MIDIFTTLPTLEEKFLDHGKVTLIDCNPRFVPPGYELDTYRVPQSARVSYNRDHIDRNKIQDQQLVSYLFRHQHTSPFEFVNVTLEIQLPIFVDRQLKRHRTFKFNEISRRYTTDPGVYFHPSQVDSSIRGKDKINKQGSKPDPENLKKREELFLQLENQLDNIYEVYHQLIELGESNETARFCLPVAAYTREYINVDLHNLCHFLRLRLDSHAQKEIRDLADAIYKVVKALFPTTMSLLFSERIENINLNSKEIESISKRQELNTDSKSEKEEFRLKKVKLGLDIEECL